MTVDPTENSSTDQDSLAPRNSPVLLPQWLTIAGIFVGFVLIFLGIATQLSEITKETAYLVMCIGFGIILVCFGTYASAKASWWQTTGAGAMAIILYFILRATVPPGDEYLKITITAEPTLVSSIRLQNSECSKQSNESFTFFVNKSAAKLVNLENITVKLAQDNNNSDVLLVPTTAILDHVKGTMGLFPGYIEPVLRFEPSSKEIKSTTRKYVYFKTQAQDSNIPELQAGALAPAPGTPAKPVVVQDHPAPSASAPSISVPQPPTAPAAEKPPSIGTAQSQVSGTQANPHPVPSPGQSGSVGPVSGVEVKPDRQPRSPVYFVSRLASDEEAVRKEAREALLAADSEAVRPLLEVIKKSPANSPMISDAIQLVGQIVQKQGKVNRAI